MLILLGNVTVGLDEFVSDDVILVRYAVTGDTRCSAETLVSIGVSSGVRLHSVRLSSTKRKGCYVI